MIFDVAVIANNLVRCGFLNAGYLVKLTCSQGMTASRKGNRYKD